MIKRLFIDIETSPNIGFFWKAGYKIDIGYENIIKERAIICIAYKWEHNNKTYCLTWDKKQNDKAALKKFINVVKTADEVVAHNGDRFDVKWIRTRCLFHGIPVMPDIKTVDTLKLAKGSFLFNSNRLDYLSKFTGSTGKIKTEYNLWKDISLNNCQKSLATMVKYCKKDVVELERIFSIMKNYVKSKSHISGDVKCCPECGSNNMKISKRRISAAGSIQLQLQCNMCGKYNTVSAAKYNKRK